MLVAVADTHTVIWYLAADVHLSRTAQQFINQTALNGDQIGISGISFIEIVYLIDKGRIPANTFNKLISELNKPESLFLEIPVDTDIATTLQRVDGKQIPDMPDRIIAATALRYGVVLISRDRKIKLSTINTIW
jgi:PIN domain nuclease of toxin-antitoxin system